MNVQELPDHSTLSPRPLLRRKAASRYIKETHGIDIAPQTMARKAVQGGGPPFRKFGRYPYYEPDELDRWVISRLGGRRRSTSDKSGPRDD
jgi:hypothetical protein